MPKEVFPSPTPDLGKLRKKLAPHVHDAFTAFSEQVFAEGAGSRVVWIADLLPDGAAPMVESMMDAGMAAMKKTLDALRG